MKDYLKGLITEQIYRGQSLKKLIPFPLKYPELSSLATRCGMIIDSNVDSLRSYLNELNTKTGHDVRVIFRGFRACARELDYVERYGVSALYYQTDEIGYLNKLVFKIHQEINLPFSPPSVACISTEYFYFHSFTNVIFVPVAESEFLLHLPDLFHEIGHAVLANVVKEERPVGVRKCYDSSVNIVKEYFDRLISEKKRETGPAELPLLLAFIYFQWKTWMEEFFSDLFGLYTLGAAYAKSHVHLTLKKSDDIYKFSKLYPLTHPSDEARMRMLKHGLELIGFKNEAKEIWSFWNIMPLATISQPVHEYQYAYPDAVLKNLAACVLEGLEESGFFIASPQNIKDLPDKSIIKILDEAWHCFKKNPDAFRHWETDKIEGLKREFALNR